MNATAAVARFLREKHNPDKSRAFRIFAKGSAFIVLRKPPVQRVVPKRLYSTIVEPTKRIGDAQRTTARGDGHGARFE